MFKNTSAFPGDEEIQNLIDKCVRMGISQGWEDISAKWKGGIQTLLVHGWNASSLTLDIMNLVGGFSHESKKEGVVASFFHDYTKAENQHNLLPEDLLRATLASLKLSEDDLKEIFAIISAIENPITPDRLFAQMSTRLKGDRRLPDVCRLADQLLVIRTLAKLDLTKGAEELLSNFNLDIEYHLVSPVRGISTQILHRALEKWHKESGFRPILHFPEGTLYLGRGKVQNLQKDELLKTLKDEFERLFEGNPAFQQGGRAFGSWTAKMITDIALVFSSNSSITDFWDTVYGKPIISGWLAKKPTPEALYQAVFYLFYALKAVVVELTDRIKDLVDSEQVYSDFKRMVMDELGLDLALSETILSVSHTTGSDTKRDLGERILNESLDYLQPDDRSPRASLEMLRNKLIVISQRLRTKYVHCIERIPKKVLEDLLDDVSRPLPQDAEKKANECWEAYSAGKKRKGTPVCCFCSRPAESVASASMFGKGAESFSNFLAGGSVIDGSNKAKVCLLCEFEESLRRALRGDYEEVIYVFPQVNLSRSMWNAWEESAQKLLIGPADLNVGVNPLSDYYVWSEIILSQREVGGLLRTIDSLKLFYDEARHEKRWIRKIADELKRRWPDLLQRSESWVPEETKEFDELAEAILSNKVTVPEDFKDQLSEGLLEGSRLNLVSNPNFIVLLTDSYSLKMNRDESETTLTLRKLFVGILLSKIFHSTAVFPSLKQETMGKVEVKGAVYLAQKTGLKKVSQILGVTNGWVPFSNSTYALKYMSALLLCEKHLRDEKADMGKDSLIKLADLIPGQILNRYAHARKKMVDVEFIKLLDLLEEARLRAGFIGK